MRTGPARRGLDFSAILCKLGNVCIAEKVGMKRKTFALIVAVVALAVIGSWAGGRLSLQEVLTVAALVLVWAFGVSLWRGIKKLRARFSLPPEPPDG